MTRVTIDHLRIQGLQGRAPTRAEVEAAVRHAIATRGPAMPPQDQRITRPAGTSLAGAAQAAFGAKPR